MLQLGPKRPGHAPGQKGGGVWRGSEKEAGGGAHGQGQCWSPAQTVADAVARHWAQQCGAWGVCLGAGCRRLDLLLSLRAKER